MPLAAASECAISPNFRKYASVYDLLYRDKDYAAEADYITRALRAAVPEARELLELGSGTGRHGRLLAANGFAVHGIERSPDMVALANAATTRNLTGGTFSCEFGDVRTIALPRNFDAVIALFHVVSYQTTDDDLRATFVIAARHLKSGGVFLFDVWHGPAVLAQGPERRVKKVGDDCMDVVRTARPHLDTAQRTVTVIYDIECRDRKSDEVLVFSETHLMRYLFAEEIKSLAAQSGFSVEASEEFLTGARPSPSTWSVAYLLRR
jgi:SAM-dependent methyltransferase